MHWKSPSADSGLRPSASTHFRQPRLEPPQSSATGAEFAWQPAAVNATMRRCRKFGRLAWSLPRENPWRLSMNQHAVVSKFSHVKPGDTEFREGGLRDFFLYRDLGIADATSGQVICHLVKANPDLPPEEGTGWHKHECDFQIVIMTKGWARFMYEDKSTLVQAGDVVHQRPGITHYLYDYSKDMEYLEIVSPADFKTVDVAPAVDHVPPPTPWK
jgi:mannose-6-phosphate isomerase-like protein (cupin superfamily)